MDSNERHEFLSGRKGIGSSDVPKILGVSNFGGPVEAYDSIVQRLEGRVPEVQEATLDQQRGIDLEELAAVRWCRANGRPRDSIRRQKQKEHPVYPFLIANLDRQVLSENGEGPSILEIKCPRWQTMCRLRDHGATEQYMVQIQHQLAVWGYSHATLCIFHPDWELMDIPVERDDEFIDNVLHPRLVSFWKQNIIPRQRPISEGGEEGPTIPEFPGGRLETDNSEELAGLLADYEESSNLLSNLSEVNNGRREKIKEYMLARDYTGVECGRAKVHFRPQEGRLTWDGPCIADKLMDMDLKPNDFKKRTKASRPFRVYFSKQSPEVQE